MNLQGFRWSVLYWRRREMQAGNQGKRAGRVGSGLTTGRNDKQDSERLSGMRNACLCTRWYMKCGAMSRCQGKRGCGGKVLAVFVSGDGVWDGGKVGANDSGLVTTVRYPRMAVAHLAVCCWAKRVWAMQTLSVNVERLSNITIIRYICIGGSPSACKQRPELWPAVVRAGPHGVMEGGMAAVTRSAAAYTKFPEQWTHTH